MSLSGPVAKRYWIMDPTKAGIQVRPCGDILHICYSSCFLISEIQMAMAMAIGFIHAVCASGHSAPYGCPWGLMIIILPQEVNT